MPSVFKPRRAARTAERPYFDVPKSEWLMPVGVLLTLSFVGLRFYPAILLLIIFMIRLFRDNRYDFVIMLTIIGAGYGFIETKLGPLNTYDVVMVVAFLLLLVYKKTRVVKATVLLLALYIAALVFLATFSMESMSLQFNMMRGYFSFVYFIIPLACFSGRKFDIEYFFRRLMIYAFVICTFYMVDSFIMVGDFFVPQSSNASEVDNSIYSPYIRPFSFQLFRKQCHGLLVPALAIYPIATRYRLHWWQWMLIAGALVSTFTFTLIICCILTYVFFQGKLLKVLKYCFFALLAFPALYLVDAALPRVQKIEGSESTLRIKSSVDQIYNLTQAVDDEDLAKFASGRVAQILPKVELVAQEHRQLTGLGFLHPQKTKMTRYVITNEYYTDVTAAEEVATAVESVPFQVYITIGWIGLLVHVLFLAGILALVYKKKDAAFVGCTMFICVFLGLSGFAPLINCYGLYMLALAYSAVLLADKSEHSGESTRKLRVMP